MEQTVDYVLVAIAGYVIGSIPSAYLIVRLLTGRDIRALGTGNVGVMNTVRQAGLPAGMLAFVGEGAKGVGAITAARIISGQPPADSLAAVMALVGVNYSVFMGFHGGRGTTVSVFMALVLLWLLVVVLGLLWLAVYRLRRDNFVATRVNILVLPFATAALLWATNGNWSLVWLATLGSIVALWRHRRETDDHYIAATQHAGSE
ncbi:MAG: glycerol-3-phosphate acyltransferase [Chloroflexi bacterium]|nr:glycerol-3-phosphate acyltransferase [Chloroflexota bacterium]